MRLFAQIPQPGGLRIKASWLRRTIIARKLFEQAVKSAAGKGRLRPLARWAIDAAEMKDSNAMSEHLQALNKLPFNQEARDLVATMTLYRRLHVAVFHNQPAWAADLRSLLGTYPEEVRRQGRMLHVLLIGILMQALPPADLEFLEEVAGGPKPALPPEKIRQRAAMIRPRPGMASAA